MKRGIGDDKVVMINAARFYSMINDVIDIDADVCKSIYTYFIKMIHDEIQCGNIVHLQGLGYFYLIMIDKTFVRRHEKQGNVDSDVIVMPCFSPTVTVTSKYTQMFGEGNIIDGVNIMKGYVDKLGKTQREQLDRIIFNVENGMPVFEDEDLLRKKYDKKIFYYEEKLKKLKDEKRSILRNVYGKGLDGKQYGPHGKLSK